MGGLHQRQRAKANPSAWPLCTVLMHNVQYRCCRWSLLFLLQPAMTTRRRIIIASLPLRFIACCAIAIVLLIAALGPGGCAAAAAPIFTADSLHAAADAHAAELMRSRSTHSAASASASVSSSSRSTHSESEAFGAVPAAAAPSTSSSSSTSSPYTTTIASALTLVSRSEQNVSTPFFPPFSLQKLADVFDRAAPARWQLQREGRGRRGVH
jgi:hypothetical protein